VEKPKFCSLAHFCSKTRNSTAQFNIPWVTENCGSYLPQSDVIGNTWTM